MFGTFVPREICLAQEQLFSPYWPAYVLLFWARFYLRARRHTPAIRQCGVWSGVTSSTVPRGQQLIRANGPLTLAATAGVTMSLRPIRVALQTRIAMVANS